MSAKDNSTAIVIGAGPAGLTAAYELLKRTSVVPIVFEASGEIGGLSRTVRYRGNRMDIGGHRFFSKSDAVTEWWKAIMPLQTAPATDDLPSEDRALESVEANPEDSDEVMLIRRRLSRILFLGRLFDYPISPSWSTVSKLGFHRMLRIALSYLSARARPIRPVGSLQDFFIDQFGAELYRTFFRDYTEKVWGVPCQEIPASWGAQRVKGLSLSKALRHSIRSLVLPASPAEQKRVETSLIGSFMYPKFGPGQLWERAASIIGHRGGRIHLRTPVEGILVDGNRIRGVVVRSPDTGELSEVEADYVLSTMPVRELIAGLRCPVPEAVSEVAAGLQYRDFITVGVLARGMSPARGTADGGLPDNWIYVQEPHVKMGRLQIFNNWSPYMVSDPSTVSIGLEYFCTEGDALWERSDEDLARFAASELELIGMVRPEDVLDTNVVRVRKAYPAYFGAYADFGVVRDFVDRFENLYLIGRNGMHHYNNMDHSMLTAMAAVDAIARGSSEKSPIWNVNAEGDYHESA